MPTSSNVPDVPQAERLRAVDRLEYVADLLLELQSIAISSKCETLAGLLNLAHAEALRQSRQI